MPFPPPKTKLQIFTTEPPADQATFASGLSATDTRQSLLAIILFSPNLQLIASLDNTNSGAETSYSTSVSTGFTFTASQSISITEEVGVNIEIVTEKTSVTFALSFSESWNTTTTTTNTFTCPAGQKVFLYQGTLMSKVLQFNASDGSYAWTGAAGRGLTQILLTSSTPVGAAPSNQVQVGS